MENDSKLGLLKEEATTLPEISPQAKDLFRRALPELLRLVDEKFELESQYKESSLDTPALDFIQDAHEHLADLLAGIYENNLTENLVDEFRWYVSVFASRGFSQDYFVKLLEGWIFAIHALVKPPESGELTSPLNWIARRLPIFLEAATAGVPTGISEQEGLLSLLLQKKRSEAWELVYSLYKKESSVDHIYFEVLIPVLNRIGQLWEKNEISVTDEHAAAAIIRHILSRLQSVSPGGKPVPYKAFVSSVPGEEHELGAEILADYLEIKGWTVYFIGHSAPEEDILKSVLALKPDGVFLSVTMISRLSEARQVIRKIRTALPETKIIMGGRAAMTARKVLESEADAVVDSIAQGYQAALKLVEKNA